jgi:enamine deaminase RidA (YjgF/YER057c/UK114 family)
VLAEAGASPKDIFKMTVYLRRNEDYNGMNEIRQEYFRKDTFVSTTVITELHAQDALVEIEVAAAVE